MDIGHLLPHVIEHKPFVSKDAYGALTFGGAVNRRARVEYKNEVIRDHLNNEVVSRGRVYLNGAVTVTVNDQIKLPDGCTPMIRNFSNSTGSSGVVYTVIYI